MPYCYMHGGNSPRGRGPHAWNKLGNTRTVLGWRDAGVVVMNSIWINVPCPRCHARYQMPLSQADKVQDFPMEGPAGGLRKVGVTCRVCGARLTATLPMNPERAWGSPVAAPGGFRNDVAGVMRDLRNGKGSH